MRIRWRLALPLAGLILFGWGSYESMQWRPASSRYFWWSSIQLDTTPLNNSISSCTNENGDCSEWEPESIVVHSGWLAKVLFLSAFPAFLVGHFVVYGFSRFGVSGLTSFMISMPLLIFGWFFLLGWLLDRRRSGRISVK
jgi:hypothetical protein